MKTLKGSVPMPKHLHGLTLSFSCCGVTTALNIATTQNRFHKLSSLMFLLWEICWCDTFSMLIITMFCSVQPNSISHNVCKKKKKQKPSHLEFIHLQIKNHPLFNCNIYRHTFYCLQHGYAGCACENN